MKQYRLWALDVPDLDPRGFSHCGNRKIRLYDGGDGGGGGDDGAAAAAAAGLGVGDASVGFGAESGTDSGAPAAAPTVDPVEQAVMEALSGLSTTVQDASGGGWGTGGGPSLGSAGLNISLGLAPNTADPFAPQAQVQNPMTLDVAAQALGMPASQLAQIQAQDAISAALMGIPAPMASTNNLDITTLNQLSELGLGNSPISNTQTVDEAIASMNAHTFLNENIDTIVGMMVPGGGAMLSGTQALGGLLSGVLTPQQALGHALGPVAGAVVPGIAGSILSSEAFGQATGLTPMTDAQLAAIVASSEGDTGGATAEDNTSGGSGNEVASAPAPAPAPTPAPEADGSNRGLAALAMLAGMGTPQTQEQAQQTELARIFAQSPFGAGPYGLRSALPYA